MARFNPDFWEIPTDNATFDRMATQESPYFESEEERERRYAFQDFFAEVKPVVTDMIGTLLTRRQWEVVQLYYFHNKTQEDIAVILNLSQSTVSRHLFGTVRGGKKVGGAIPKLRKAVNRSDAVEINTAFGTLQEKLAEAAA